MFSQIEPHCFTISLAGSTQEPLVHRLSLANNPLGELPLLPGESIHIGYIPMSEVDAFAVQPKIQPLLAASHFRIDRSEISAERIAELIHRFISINDAVERLVPKREYLNLEPGKRLYEAKVTHSWREEHATIQVSLIALRCQGEPDEFAVNVNRLRGSVTAHLMFFHTLEQYVKNRGQTYPIIRPISVDREALATAVPPELI